MKKVLNIIGVALGVCLTLAMTVYALAHVSASGKMLGAVTARGSAELVVADQLGATRTLVVERVVAPDESWVAVYTVGMGGMPGQLVGYVHANMGETRHLLIPLDPSIRLTEKVLVTLNVDRGVRSRFEFAPLRFDSSPDKPYYIGGVEIGRRVIVRWNEMGNAV